MLVLAIAVLAIAVFGTSTQTWIEVQLDPAGASSKALHVQGNKAATAVTALALVALAGGLAASIAGRVARWIIAALIALSAVGIVAAVIRPGEPVGAAQGSIAGPPGYPAVRPHGAYGFPVIALVAGVLLALARRASVGRPLLEVPDKIRRRSRRVPGRQADQWMRSTVGTACPAAKTPPKAPGMPSTTAALDVPAALKKWQNVSSIHPEEISMSKTPVSVTRHLRRPPTTAMTSVTATARQRGPASSSCS